MCTQARWKSTVNFVWKNKFDANVFVRTQKTAAVKYTYILFNTYHKLADHICTMATRLCEVSVGFDCAIMCLWCALKFA